MKENKLSKIYIISRRATTALCLLLALAFIISAACIYYGGGSKPYSREIVGEHLLYLLPISVLTVAAAVTAGVSSVMLGTEAERLKASISSRIALKRLYDRYRISAANRAGKGKGDKCLIATPEVYDRIDSHHKKRVLANSVFTALVALSIAIALIFILDPSAYTVEDLNGSSLRAALISIAPASVIIFGIILTGAVCSRSFRREIDEFKILISTVTPSVVPLEKRSRGTGRLTAPILRGVLLVLAIGLVIIGLIGTSANSVLQKAIAICTECIGLG